jgi:hypothetical protein
VSRLRARVRAILPLLALGVSLARRGILPVLAIAICALTSLAASGLAVVLANRGTHAPVHDVPLLASSALAWGGGFLLAFAASAHALRKDRAEGIRDLLVTRTTSLRGYLVARVGGLAAVLAVIVGGGTLFAGLAAVLAGHFAAAPRTLQATLAGLVFALAFSLVIAPVALAAVGARSRIGGYLFLLFVVVFPEVLASSLSDIVPESITEVLSIPSALVALRSALAPGGLDFLRAVRALVAIALFVTFAVLIVKREVAQLEQPEVGA